MRRWRDLISINEVSAAPFVTLRRVCNSSSYHRNRQVDAGFTLVELLIVVVILPLIIGAIAISLLSIFQNQAAVSNRLTSSGDAQAVAASYYRDLQSGATITTQSPSSPQCGTNSSLVSVQWLDSNSNVITLVTYAVVPNNTSNGATTYSLVRSQCTISGTSNSIATPISVRTLATNIPATGGIGPDVTVSLNGYSCSFAITNCLSALSTPTLQYSAAHSWVAATGLQSVVLVANDTGSTTSDVWRYALSGVPRDWIPITCSGSACAPTGGGWWISGPSTVLAANVTSQGTNCPGNSGGNYHHDNGNCTNSSVNNILNGACTINVPSIGLNSSTVTIDGNGTPFVNTTFYGSSGQQVPLSGANNPPTVTAISALSQDPFATYYSASASGATITGNSFPGFPYIYPSPGSSFSNWSSLPVSNTLTGGTVYITTSSSLPSGYNIVPGNNGSTSVFIWDTSATNLSLDAGQLNLGVNGILYAPNATLTLNGNSTLSGSNVVVQQMTCDGGGNSGGNLVLTRRG